jgi:hypothetical protein
MVRYIFSLQQSAALPTYNQGLFVCRDSCTTAVAGGDSKEATPSISGRAKLDPQSLSLRLAIRRMPVVRGRILDRAMQICTICPARFSLSRNQSFIVKNCIVSAISYGFVGREGPGAEDIKNGLFRRMRSLHWKAGTRRLYMGTSNHPPKAADEQEV